MVVFLFLLQFIGDGELDEPDEWCSSTKTLYAPVLIHDGPGAYKSLMSCAWVIHNAYELVVSFLEV